MLLARTTTYKIKGIKLHNTKSQTPVHRELNQFPRKYRNLSSLKLGILLVFHHRHHEGSSWSDPLVWKHLCISWIVLKYDGCYFIHSSTILFTSASLRNSALGWRILQNIHGKEGSQNLLFKNRSSKNSSSMHFFFTFLNFIL